MLVVYRANGNVPYAVVEENVSGFSFAIPILLCTISLQVDGDPKVVFGRVRVVVVIGHKSPVDVGLKENL